MNNVTVLGQCTVRVVSYPPRMNMDAHAHDEDGISIVLGGSLFEEVDHRVMHAGPGWIVRKPAGTYHANRFGPAGATLLALTPAEPILRRESMPWTWFDSPRLFHASINLLRATILRSGVHEETTRVFTELKDSVSSSPPAWLNAVRARLDRGRYAPSVESLAAAAGVHPVYLARRFRAAYGASLREYRQIRQVHHAMHLVAATPRSLGRIAHECGFFDQSHMCRSFRRIVGINPAAFRVTSSQ